MEGFAVLTEMILSTALLIAASQKVFGASSWRAARLEIMEQIPVAAWSAVPMVEAVVAVALGVGVRPFAGVAAGMLFTAFSLVLIVAYRNGSRADCNCFGGLVPMKIGPAALGRAATFAVASLALVVVGDPSTAAHPMALAIPLVATALVTLFSTVRTLVTS